MAYNTYTWYFDMRMVVVVKATAMFVARVSCAVQLGPWRRRFRRGQAAPLREGVGSVQGTPLDLLHRSLWPVAPLPGLVHAFHLQAWPEGPRRIRGRMRLPELAITSADFEEPAKVGTQGRVPLPD